LTVVDGLEALLSPWRFPATLGTEVLEFGFDTGVVTVCFGTVAVALEAWVPLPGAFEVCACLPLDVLFVAALACTASS